MPKVTLLTLPLESYSKLTEVREQTGLDFDDSYQMCIADEYDLTIATMDKDFEKVKGKVKVKFI